MNLLIVDNFHHKNRKGMEMICTKNGWNYKYAYGSLHDIEKIIPGIINNTKPPRIAIPDKIETKITGNINFLSLWM